MFHLNRDTLLWKSIFSQLGITCPEGYWEEAEDSEFFPQPFQRFMNVRDGLKKHDTSKREQTSSRLEYNIEFRKQLDTGNVKVSQHPLSEDKIKTTEELIVHSTIVYAYDDSYFVVIQTKDRSGFWTRYEEQNPSISIPRYSRATVYRLEGGNCEYIGFKDLPFEVAAQDILVYKGMLFLLPIKDPEVDDNPAEILIIYSIKDERSNDVLMLKSSYCLQPTPEYPERYRISPHVYKESGEKRLYILNNRILQPQFIEILIIAPCPVWTIMVLKLNVLNGDMLLIKEVSLSNVSLDAIGQVFTADQKNSTLAFAFYTSSKCKRQRNHKIMRESWKSMISVVDICPTATKQSKEIYVENHHEDMLPNIINNSFNLKGRVEDMKLYYLSATNYYHSLYNSYIIHESSRKPNKCNGFYAPIIVFLLASDRIVLYSSHHYNYVDLQLLFGKNNRFQSKNWHHSEVQVQDKVKSKSS